MKKSVFTFLFFLFVSFANGQTPVIGTIDFYGLQTVSEPQIRDVLQIKEGDLPPKEAQRSAIEKRILALPNVEQSQISTICCTAENKAMLYVGVREKGAPSLNFRFAPNGDIRLTDEIIALGEAFSAAHRKAILSGDTAEDDSQGHSLMKNAEARAVQERFVTIAAKNLKLLKRVLRESADASHRALAVQIIAYSKNKQAIVEDLVYGMKDSDSDVRNDSMRALGIIAGYSPSPNKKKIKVPYAPFVDMLNSIEWTDRNKSSLALMRLTETRDADLLAQLRERALPSLFNLASWKNRGYSTAGFIILARVALLPEEEIIKSAVGGDWEQSMVKVKKILQ